MKCGFEMQRALLPAEYRMLCLTKDTNEYIVDGSKIFINKLQMNVVTAIIQWKHRTS
jgi:hypothetical protein